MLTQEIIQVSRVSESHFRTLSREALNHALWQFILYYDTIDELEKDLSCLLKESLSKLLFKLFCSKNDLPIVFDSAANERHLKFQIEDDYWEQINVSVNDIPFKESNDIALLPGLIPSNKLDCNQKDDYGTKLVKWSTSKSMHIVFTYLNNNSNTDCFIELNISKGLEQLLSSYLKRKIRGKNLNENMFWKKLRPQDKPEFSIRHFPDFYITAWAGKDHWKFFYNSKSNDFPNLSGSSEQNKAMMIHRLPAFSQLFPMFSETLNFGKFLN